MPKILFITDSLHNGGAERQLTLLAKYLPPNWECRVWSTADGTYKNVLNDLGIQTDICQRQWRFDVSPAWGLWKIVRTWKPDIIHAWEWMSALAAIPICRCLQIPLINSIRIGRRPAYRSTITGLSLKFADGVIANSREGLTAWDFSSPKGVVIHNGFDPERLALCFPVGERNNNCFTVVMAGRMAPQKDFKLFIQAAREFRNLGIPAHFMAVGNGVTRPGLIEAGEDLVNQGYLSFPEAGLEIIPYLNRANVGVLMSNPSNHAEGISNVIMEYMACGLPVICNDSGGNREIVIENENGYLIPSGDVQQLVEKLLFLYKNPLISKKLGQSGNKQILTKFSCKMMIDQTLDFYQGMIMLRNRKKSGFAL